RQGHAAWAPPGVSLGRRRRDRVGRRAAARPCTARARDASRRVRAAGPIAGRGPRARGSRDRRAAGGVSPPARSRYRATGALAEPGCAEGDADVTGSDVTTALIVVDVQNDFCPGGALGVRGGDRLAPLIAEAAGRAGTLVATRDVHPPDHISFAERAGRWPAHSVQGTAGAELHASLAGMPFDF